MNDALDTWDTVIAAQMQERLHQELASVAQCGSEALVQIGVEHLYKELSGSDLILGADPDIFWALIYTLLLTARIHGGNEA